MNVRAPEPPDVQESSGKRARLRYRLSFHEAEGRYRVHTWPEGSQPPPADSYREMGRYETREEVDAALAALPDHARWVVFEDTRSGDVHLQNTANLSGDWSGGGRYDQFTVFSDEADAAAYADRLRGGRS